MGPAPPGRGRRRFIAGLTRRGCRLRQRLGGVVARRARVCLGRCERSRLDRRGFQLRYAFVDRVQRRRLREAGLRRFERPDPCIERFGRRRLRDGARVQRALARGEVRRRPGAGLEIPSPEQRGRAAQDCAAKSPDEGAAELSLALGWFGSVRDRRRRVGFCRGLRPLGRFEVLPFLRRLRRNEILRRFARRGFALGRVKLGRLAFDHDRNVLTPRRARRLGFGFWGRVVGHSLSPIERRPL